MSAPARARLVAVRASRSSEGSLSTKNSSPDFFDHATVAVAGVFAQADVGDEHELFAGGRLLEGAETLLDDAVVVPCAGGLFVLGVGQAEEQEAANAELRGFFGFAKGFIDGKIEHSGHGTHRVAYTFARAEKERVDQVAGLKRGFANQGAQRFGAPQTTHAILRKTHGSIVGDQGPGNRDSNWLHK